MEKINIESFLARINEQGLPAFARTARLLSGLVADEKSSIVDMANLILQDSSITARVIRLANSAFYNPAIKKISTVNRAIVQLGIQAIESICITAALVENILSGETRERVICEMLRAFQAAIHAKSFAQARREPNVEEIFIAALLLRIGHFAFWSLGGEIAEKLEGALKEREGKVKPFEIEKEVLGFSLNQITMELVHQWRLGDLLQRGYLGNAARDPKIYCLFLSHALVNAMQNAGNDWSDPELQSQIKKVATFIHRSPDEVRELIRVNYKKTFELVSKHGLGEYVRFIRSPDDISSHPIVEAQQEQGDPIADTLLQMDILRELSDIIKSGKPDVNVMFSTLMEGISRGIAMDRVVLLIFGGADRKRLKGRYSIGPNLGNIRQMSFSSGGTQKNIFDYVVEMKKNIWVNGSRTPELLKYVTAEIQSVLGAKSFFLMSLNVKDLPIGVVYADRYPSGRNMDEESFLTFQFFSRLINVGLDSLAAPCDS